MEVEVNDVPDGALLPTPTSAKSYSTPKTPQNTTENADSLPSVSPDLDLSVKHPLHHSWILWYDNPGSKRVAADKWVLNLKPVATFLFIEDFWGTINNIRRPSRLASGSNYHLFKTGIKPMWEDSSNKIGGKWVVNVPKKQKETVDENWQNLMLAMIGEQFEHTREVCGGVVSIRKSNDRVALWTRNAQDKTVCLSLGVSLRQHLELPASQKIEYAPHIEQPQGTPPMYELPLPE